MQALWKSEISFVNSCLWEFYMEIKYMESPQPRSLESILWLLQKWLEMQLWEWLVMWSTWLLMAANLSLVSLPTKRGEWHLPWRVSGRTKCDRVWRACDTVADNSKCAVMPVRHCHTINIMRKSIQFRPNNRKPLLFTQNWKKIKIKTIMISRMSETPKFVLATDGRNIAFLRRGWIAWFCV